MFTARDRLRIKPLYYFKDEDQLILSSEIKPLLYYLKETSFEETAFAKFFFKQELESNKNTFFKNIKMHEPAVLNFLQAEENTQQFIGILNRIKN